MKKTGTALVAAVVSLVLLFGGTVTVFAATSNIAVEGSIHANAKPPDPPPDPPPDTPQATSDITSFTLAGVAGNISGTNITVEVPAGTDVTSLTPVITHNGASIDKSGPQDFTSPVTYTVTAQDGTAKTYTVTVTVTGGPPQGADGITSFILAGVAGIISGTNITLELPAGTNVTALIPIIGYNGKSIYPFASSPQDFTDPVMYTVIAQDDSPKTYIVTVTVKDVDTELNGWVRQTDGTWMYYIRGVYVTGWNYIGRVWYYFNAKGIMQTGWLYDRNYTSWFYLTASGAMKTGWLEDAGRWYYLAGDGKMKVGWLRYSGGWYYFGGNGAMKTLWVKDRGTWYYLRETGIMAENAWVRYKDNWYYLRPTSGTMPQSKWLRYGGSLYYLKADGRMAFSETRILNGRPRTFDSTGRLRASGLYAIT
jgi:hypothetical protein